MRTWIVAVALCGALACGGSESEPRLPQPSPPAPEVEKSVAAEAAKSAPADPANSATEAPKPSSDGPAPPAGWSAQLVTDEVPLCIFTDYVAREKAEFLHKVGQQKLKANAPVVFGAFAPRCLHRTCDDDPTLQAWVDEEGDGTFVVHSRFHALHKDGTTCTKDCERVIAGAQTRELAPGTYTVRYGKLTRKFKVPGVLKSPCLGPR